MKNLQTKNAFLFFTILLFAKSCIPVRHLKPFIDEKDVVLTQEGYIATNKKPYKVKVGDEIRITILADDPNMVKYLGREFVDSSNGSSLDTRGTENFKGRVVDQEGYIQMPRLGRIYVKGKTFTEIGDEVEKLLKKLYKGETNIKVGLVSYTFYIAGEVGQSRQYNSYRQLNLMEALTMSGSLPLTANRNEIRVFKKEDNGYRLVKLDLSKMSTINLSEFYIDNNDIIQVDPIKTKTLGIGSSALGTILTITSFITSMVTFFIFIKRL